MADKKKHTKYSTMEYNTIVGFIAEKATTAKNIKNKIVLYIRILFISDSVYLS